MTLMTVLFWFAVSVGAACGVAIANYREIMLREVQARVDLRDRMQYPRLSWNFPELLRLHKEIYPQSQIATKIRWLRSIFVASMISAGAVLFFSTVGRRWIQ